ncbi:MAG: DUF3761 domain-containing protein [Streptomyces sp.]|nr:DUF3761 domain-containing protein [Streptomyces sp.]
MKTSNSSGGSTGGSSGGDATATCAPHTVGTCAADSPHPAQCQDGSYSFSASFRGTCSHHGGVRYWYQ